MMKILIIVLILFSTLTHAVYPEKKVVKTQTAGDEEGDNSPHVADLPMDRDNEACKVGRTSVYYMALDASAGYKTTGFFGDEAWIWIQYEWPESDYYYTVKID